MQARVLEMIRQQIKQMERFLMMAEGPVPRAELPGPVSDARSLRDVGRRAAEGGRGSLDAGAGGQRSSALGRIPLGLVLRAPLRATPAPS